jgi:hypothetical protein
METVNFEKKLEFHVKRDVRENQISKVMNTPYSSSKNLNTEMTKIRLKV